MNQHVPVTQMMCPHCQKLPLAKAGAQPHTDLRLQGAVPATRNDSTTQDHQYRCQVCHTVWLRRTDRWGMDVGFRLAP